ncbi:MAG: VOC family protein [Bilifractor sp.]
MNLDHVTINVTDMNVTEKFYESVFGLKKLPSVDMGDHEIHYYDLGGGTLLELIEYKDEQPEMHPEVKTKGIYRHLAFRVDDLEKTYENARKAGAKIICEPAYVPKLKFHNFLMLDPNGVELEVLKRD